MKHPKIRVQELAGTLRKAVGDKSLTGVANAAGVDVSRVSRFLNGDFKKLTPVLSRLCANLGITASEFLIDSPPSELPQDILNSLGRIVGKDPKKVLAVTRLFQNLEMLASGSPLEQKRR